MASFTDAMGPGDVYQASDLCVHIPWMPTTAANFAVISSVTTCRLFPFADIGYEIYQVWTYNNLTIRIYLRFSPQSRFRFIWYFIFSSYLNPHAYLYGALTLRATATIQVIVMESILILRVWVIVGRKRNVLLSFSILLFLNVAATLGIYFAMPTTSLTFYYWWGILFVAYKFCDWWGHDGYFRLPMILFELIMFLTAAFYGVRGMQATNLLTQMRQNFGPKPIMDLLLRDSVFYFLMYVTLNPSLSTCLTMLTTA